MTALRRLTVPALFALAAALPSSIAAMNIALAALLVVWLFAAEQRERARFGDAVLPLAPWTAAIVAAWLAADALPPAKLSFFYAWLAYPLVVTFLPQVDRRRWLQVFFAVLTVVCALGIVQHVFGNRWLDATACDEARRAYTGGLKQFWCGYKAGTRARGLFYTPMTFGAVVLYGLLAATWWLSRLRSRLLAVALVIFAVTLAFTSSRNAWVGLAAGLPFVLGFNKKAWLTAAAVAVLLVAVAWVSPALRTRVTSFAMVSSDPSTSTGARIFLWKDAVAQFKERPVLGWGPGTFHDNVERRHPDVRLLSTRHAHNSYLQALAETGMVGLVGMLASWIWLGLRAWRRGGAGPLGVAVLLGFAMAGLFEANYLDSEVIINVLAWLAFATVYPKTSET